MEDDALENYENNDNTQLPIKNKSTVVSLLVAQVVCVSIILISVVITKYFFSGYYKTIKNWYSKYFCSDTSISEVLNTSGGDKDEV